MSGVGVSSGKSAGQQPQVGQLELRILRTVQDNEVAHVQLGIKTKREELGTQVIEVPASKYNPHIYRKGSRVVLSQDGSRVAAIYYGKNQLL